MRANGMRANVLPGAFVATANSYECTKKKQDTYESLAHFSVKLDLYSTYGQLDTGTEKRELQRLRGSSTAA